MKLIELFEEEDVLELPDIEKGDEVKVGRFKNRKATVKGFKKDDHNQPVLKTTKGDQKLFKPRISKLEENTARIPMGFWINPNKNDFFKASDEHIDYITRYPERFGLDNETVEQVQTAYAGYNRDGWAALLELVGNNGWVRGGSHVSKESRHGVFFQGDNEDIIHSAALMLIEKGYYFDEVWFDTTFESFNVSLSTFNVLNGKRLDYWLKTGKWPSRSNSFR